MIIYQFIDNNKINVELFEERIYLVVFLLDAIRL